MEIIRPFAFDFMDLRRALIERAHVIAMLQQFVGEVGAQKTGSSRDENLVVYLPAFSGELNTKSKLEWIFSQQV